MILQLKMLRKIQYNLKLCKKEIIKKVWKKIKMMMNMRNKKKYKREKKLVRVQLKMSREQLQIVKNLLNQKLRKY